MRIVYCRQPMGDTRGTPSLYKRMSRLGRARAKRGLWPIVMPFECMFSKALRMIMGQRVDS